jgi:CubicO group peptidase (beta-lactamase class C family)
MARSGLTRRSFVAGAGGSLCAMAFTNSAEAGTIWHDRTLADHNRKYAAAARAGLGLESLCLYGERDDPLCVAIVAPLPPGVQEQQFVGLSLEDWRKRVVDMASQGLGPTIVTATGPAGNPVLGAVFRTMSATPEWAVDLSAADFKKRNKAAAKKASAILTWADAYGAANDARLIGIWSNDPFARGWLCGPTEETVAAMQGRLAALEPTGARVAHLTLTPSGKLLALLQENGGEVPLWRADMTGVEIKAEFLAKAAKGWRPLRICAKGSGANARFAAVFASGAPNEEPTFRASGPYAVPEIDAAMATYMRANGLHGAALAIINKTRLVYAKGYTWARRDYPDVLPTTYFRQASVSKLFTALALYQIMQERPSVTLDTTMQSILRLRTPDNKPPVDARFNDITIRQLIESTNGFDNGLIWRSVEAAAAAKASLPATSDQVERFAASLGLTGVPGDPKHVTYSNAGYFMAGRILARLRKTDDLVQALQPFLKPLMIGRVRSARSIFAAQAPDEARYHEYQLSTSQSGRSPQRPIVPTQYGGWDAEMAGGAGGLSVAVTDVARIAAMLSMREGNPVLSPSSYDALFENAATATATLTGPEAHGYHGFDGVKKLGKGLGYRGNKGGFLTGSQTDIEVNTNSLSFVVAINGNEREGGADSNWITLIRPIAAKYDWPSNDLFPQFGMASLSTP